MKYHQWYLLQKKRMIYQELKLNFFEESVRCAYLLRFSVLYTISTINHFQKVQTGDSSLFDRFLTSETIRVCCLGGGPGVELVAICQAVNDYLNRNYEENDSRCLKLYFTIIDICNDWEDWTAAILKKLRKCSELCSKDRLEIRLRFIHADLTKRWSEDVENAIKKSDILTMVRFMSMLIISEHDFEKHRDLSMISKIIQRMKLNSWIFFLDYAGGSFYKKITEKLRGFQYLDQCYSSLHEKLTIEEIIKHQIAPIPNCFVHTMMRTHHSTTLSSGTWQKRVPAARIDRRKNPKCSHKLTKHSPNHREMKISQKFTEDLILSPKEFTDDD